MKNYHQIMNEIIEKVKLQDDVPTILLHTCCAPCSSLVIKRLSDYFKITVFYYNPNISPKEEYLKRKNEQKRFIKEFTTLHPVSILDCDYEGEEFFKVSHGFEEEKEGGARCEKCFLLRLRKTAFVACKNHFDYFGTSLTVSPYKNATLLNEIGRLLEQEYHVSFLYSDFKKENGYLNSIQLSKQYHLYRQDYCGCIFSKMERDMKKIKE